MFHENAAVPDQQYFQPNGGILASGVILIAAINTSLVLYTDALKASEKFVCSFVEAHWVKGAREEMNQTTLGSSS